MNVKNDCFSFRGKLQKIKKVFRSLCLKREWSKNMLKNKYKAEIERLSEKLLSIEAELKNLRTEKWNSKKQSF